MSTYIGVNPKQDLRPFISVKPMNAYPVNVLKQIKLISLKKDDSHPFGSFIYRVQKYPGDVDLIEEFTDCCSIDEVIKKFEKRLKIVVKKIKKEKSHYFTEFKGGIDERYNVDIGMLERGIYYPGDKLPSQIRKLNKNGLLPNDELDALRHIFDKDILDSDDFDVVFNIFREHMILRWKEDEILRGYKILPKGVTRYLSDSLREKGYIKIDMVTVINGKFVEVTNFFALSFIKNGIPVPMNIDIEEDHNIAKKLPFEVEKLYFSNFYYNPFKMVKRMYSLTRHNRDLPVLQKILPVISSNISLIYQIKSEIDAIILVLELNKDPSPRSIFENLDNMKLRLSTALEIDEEELDTFNEFIDKANKTKNKNKKIEILKVIKQELVRIINYETIVYLDKIGLNPPLSHLLPKEIAYDRSIKRTPFDMPENPLKKIMTQVKGGSLASWTYKNMANMYRRNYCDGARPLLDGEYHLGCHNFTGPGTRVDLPEVANYPPYNDIDACSRTHDFDYENNRNNPEMIRKADEDAIKCYNKFPNESGYNAAKLGINGKMSLENVLPALVKSISPEFSGKGIDNMENVFWTRIREKTLDNKFYRKVVFTGKHQQLVLMSINPGDNIPMEMHDTNDQFISIEQGEGMLYINNNKKYKLKAGKVAIIPAGTYHEIVNISNIPLKLYVIYSPPLHPKNEIQETRGGGQGQCNHYNCDCGNCSLCIRGGCDSCGGGEQGGFTGLSKFMKDKIYEKMLKYPNLFGLIN